MGQGALDFIGHDEYTDDELEFEQDEVNQMLMNHPQIINQFVFPSPDSEGDDLQSLNSDISIEDIEILSEVESDTDDEDEADLRTDENDLQPRSSDSNDPS